MKNISMEQRKKNYLADVYAELSRRGISLDDVPRVIEKTGFMGALNDYPEEQMHYSISDAVDEILLVAALN